MTKTQLEARVQTLSEVLEAFDIERFTGPSQAWTEWTNDYRESLYNRLVAARKALAKVEEEAVSKTNDFDLLLADEKRKAYDEGYNNGYDRGKAEGQVIGYANGLAQGKIDGDWTGYARGHAVGHDRGYKACALDHEIEIVEP